MHLARRLNLHDQNNLSALACACDEGFAHCAKVLLEARADVDGVYNGFVIHTPLMLACDNGHVGCVEVLIEHRAWYGYALGEDMPLVEKGQPRTALQFAEEGAMCEDDLGKECAKKLREYVQEVRP